MPRPSPLKIGVIGDYDPRNPTHPPTTAALHRGGCTVEWLRTDEAHDYAKFDGLFCSPGSPYRSEAGALAGIRYARENGVPLLGTCGGFQHIVLEYARNVMGLAEAAHEENDPHAAESNLFVSRLVCSLVGKTMTVMVEPGSLAGRCYGTQTAEEQYYCNFGLNPRWRERLGPLRITGADQDGEPRIVELSDHPFLVGTLFVPQMRPGDHPLIQGYLRAVEARAGAIRL